MDVQALSAAFNLTESIYSPVPGVSRPVPPINSEGANCRMRRDVPAGLSISRLQHCSEETRSISITGSINAALTATEYVGLLRLEFPTDSDATYEPYIFAQATRQNQTGEIHMNAEAREISGFNLQQQDYALGINGASNFSEVLASHFPESFAKYGTALNDTDHDGSVSDMGDPLGAYMRFGKNVS